MPTGVDIQQEAIARAALGVESARSPVVGSSEARAQQIRERQKNEGWRSVVQSFREQKMGSPDKARLDRLNHNNIGTERNSDGTKKLSLAEQDRMDRANDIQRILRTYLDKEKGFKDLGPRDKKYFIDAMNGVVRSVPELDAMFSSMSEAERNTAIAELVQKPEFIAKVREQFGIATDDSKALKDTVSEARNKYNEAQTKEAAKEAQKKRYEREQTDVNTVLSQFEIDRDGNPGAKLRRLQVLQASEPDLLNDREARQAELDDRKQEIQAYLNQIRIRKMRDPLFDETPLMNTVKDLRLEARTLQSEVGKINGQLQEKQALMQERESLQQRRRELEDKLSEFDGELPTLTRERLSAQAAFEDAKITRETEEEQYIEGMHNVVSEAAMAYVEEKLVATEQTERAIDEETKAKEASELEKKMIDEMRIRWDDVKGGKLKGFNKEYINWDYNTLMTEGPEKVMSLMLTRQHFTPTEIEEKLKDPDFMAKMQPKVVERLLTRRIQTGKITSSEARKLVESDWGQGMIQKAIENKGAVRDAVQELQAQGLFKGNLGEILKNKSDGSILKLLLLLLGSVATAGALPATMALRSALQER